MEKEDDTQMVLFGQIQNGIDIIEIHDAVRRLQNSPDHPNANRVEMQFGDKLQILRPLRTIRTKSTQILRSKCEK